MQNTTDTTKERPLGYWLRAADRLITDEFAAAFESEGITRREWMIINVLDGTFNAPELTDRIQRGGKRLRRLVERGWIVDADGTWSLTDDGRAAKARLGESVAAIRAKVAGAVTPEDFATTLASLESIARTLGGDESVRMPRGHRHAHGRPHRHDGDDAFGDRDHRGHGRRGHGHHGHPQPGDHGCRHGHGVHSAPHHGPDDAGERAFARGFDAGFARGAAHRAD